MNVERPNEDDDDDDGRESRTAVKLVQSSARERKIRRVCLEFVLPLRAASASFVRTLRARVRKGSGSEATEQRKKITKIEKKKTAAGFVVRVRPVVPSVVSA